MQPTFRKKSLAASVGLACLLLCGTAHAASTVFKIVFQGLQAPASLAISPTTFDFGGVNLGQSASTTFTISNSGGTAVSGLQYTASTNYSVSGTCGPQLAAGAQCTETATFTPTSAGPVPGVITVKSGSLSAAASVSGTGLQISDQVNVGALTFPGQTVGTTSSAQSVQLTNTGNTPVSVGTIGTTGPYAATQNCGNSLAVGASCTINVTFTPTGMNSQPGNLNVTTATGTQTVTLSGTGLEALLAASPSSITFPNTAINSSSSSTVTLTNSGNTPASLAFSALPTGFSQTNTCGSTLTSNSSCSITLTYAPTTSGSPSGQLSITGGITATNISLSGQSSCTAGSQTFTSSGTFNPVAGCGTYLVLAVGGGGSGSPMYMTGVGGGGGGGYVNVAYANNLSGSVAVTVGSGGASLSHSTVGAAGASSCFGSSICANGGAGAPNTGLGGAGGTGGGRGNGAVSNGGSGGSASSDGTAAGQGSYLSALALFKQSSVTAGAGGTGYVSPSGATYDAGGGGGGVLLKGAGPSGGTAAATGSGSTNYNNQGYGYGAGGGGGTQSCAGSCVGAGGQGGQGLVYIEWSQ